MRKNVVVSVVCVGVIWLAAVLLPTASEGMTSVSPDYRDIAAQLVQRGDASLEGRISFRQYRFVTQASDFDALAALLLESQSAPMPNVRSAAEQWVTGHMPAEREAWIGDVAYRNGMWKAQRIRMAEHDTALAMLWAHATAANMTPAPAASDVITHVSGEEMTVVKDNRSVIKSVRSGHRHPAVPMDISLASWQEAIDLGANVEGQEILAEVDGARQSILYVNHRADGSWGAAEYVFRGDLDWAPSELRSFDEAGTDARSVYGYDLAAASPMTRPAVVAQGQLTDTGEIDAVVWVIDSWTESCTAAAVALRLPPVRLEVDYLVSPDDPLVVVVEPEYLESVESCFKAVVAATYVVMSIGTEEQTVDFDCDGYVTSDDIGSAIDLFSGTDENP